MSVSPTAPRCCVSVPVPGMNVPRFRQCSRVSVTTDAQGLPVCRQHSPEAEAARRVKAAKADARNRILWHSRFTRKGAP